jgi:hypothetical protein
MLYTLHYPHYPLNKSSEAIHIYHLITIILFSQLVKTHPIYLMILCNYNNIVLESFNYAI